MKRTQEANVLLVEDDASLREALQVTLELEGISFNAAECAEMAFNLLERSKPSVLVSDIRLPGLSGLDLLAKSRIQFPDLPVVLMTAYADTRTAVDALRGGARDFLLKPFKPEQFIEVIKRYLQPEDAPMVSTDGPVAVDPSSRRLLQKLDRVAQTDTSVLLLGESGSGKEVMAQYLHQRSARSKQNFVAINCAAIPPTLLEATLFGHEKGAFTGAIKSQPGKFELAQGGSIFLDEIGEMPLDLQAKMLRVLQERQVERVGSHQTIALDVRFIAATNQDLSKRVAQGLFREDLYYRINVFPLKIEPLRERPGDVMALAERFLLKYRASMGLPEAKLSQESRKALLAHQWPGNVRELENAIQRGLLLCDGVWINPSDMDLESGSAQGASFKTPRLGTQDDASSVGRADEPLKPLAGPPGSLDGAPKPLSAPPSSHGPTYTDARNQGTSNGTGNNRDADDMRQVEQDHILSVLRKVGGSRKKAVQILGISERTLRYKLKTWKESGIEIP